MNYYLTLCRNFILIVNVVIHLFSVVSKTSVANVNNLPPVILVPGDGGSRLEAKLNKTSTVHASCDKTTKDFIDLWLDVKKLLPIAVDCWEDNMKLNYDEGFNRTLNQPGVLIRVPGFGDPKIVEYLDPYTQPVVGGYFDKIASSLVSLGYIRGKNLHGAPYDFRRGPSELGDFFRNLTTLVQTTYEANGKTPVVLMAHSMGGPLSLIFLHNKPKKWKEKYIRSLVSLAGAYGGSVKALKIFTAGEDLGVFFLNQKVLKSVLSTMPSSVFLLPNEQLWSDEIVVSTKNKNYSLKNMDEFFNDINFTTGWKMLQNEEKFRKDLSNPGVEVHCLYGQGVSTIKQLIYRSNMFPDDPMFTYENGDGTVNLRSLQVCKQWICTNQKRVHTQGFEGVDHMNILKNKDVIDYIRNRIKNWSNGL